MKKNLFWLLTFLPIMLLATPLAPTDLKLVATSSSVQLSWQDHAKNETGYKIIRDGVLIDTIGKNSTSYTDKNLQPNTEYHYTVKATDDIPQKSMVISTKESFGTDGEPLTFKVYNLAGGDKDWLGVFAKGSEYKRETLLAWTYTHGLQNGEITVTDILGADALAAGEYQIVAFYNDSYNPESVSYFSISDTPTIQTTQDVYNLNTASITVDISNATTKDNNQDWIGVYKENDENVWEKRKGWAYNNQNGIGIPHGKITIQQDIDLSEEGRYEVRFFADESFKLITKSTFVVSKQAANENDGIVRKVDDNEVKIYHRKDEANAPVVIFLPGYEILLSENTSLIEFIARQGYYVIALADGYYSYTKIKNELDKALNDNNADTSRVAIVGHSLGGSYTFSYMKELKKANYARQRSSVIALDGWFAFGMTPTDMQNFDTKSLIMAFGDIYGIPEDNGEYFQDPIINLAVYTMLGGEEKRFLRIEADNSHRYLLNSDNYVNKTDLLTPIHKFLDYSLKDDIAAKNEIPEDNHQEVQNFIEARESKKDENNKAYFTYDGKNYTYQFGCKYKYNDLYNYCDLNNLISNGEN